MDGNTFLFNEQKKIEVIVRQSKSLLDLRNKGIEVEELLAGFSILKMDLEQLNELKEDHRILQFSISKPMVLNAFEENLESCITELKERPENLHGEGVLMAIIDSGIDIERDDFQKDGESRILYLYDQTREKEFSREELQNIIENGSGFSPEERIFENSSHGTAVASIAAGSSPKIYLQGVADKSPLIIVRLKKIVTSSDVMRAVTYVIQKMIFLNMPMVINLSLGSSLGAHRGNSLLEQYIDTVSNFGKVIFCIGVGNEGNTAGHCRLAAQEKGRMEFTVGKAQSQLVLQLWRNIRNTIRMYFVSFDGNRYEILLKQGFLDLKIGELRLQIFINFPTPTNFEQEILIYLGEGIYEIPSGIYAIEIEVLGEEKEIMEGYMMDSVLRSRDTRFTNADPYKTMTVPSMARRCISVAACNVKQGSYAAFSGRGSLENDSLCPDLAAKGVDVLAANSSGYGFYSGTSFATPLVSGSCALLMEWGIVKGNDPFLYGEKLKAVLSAGAKQSSGVTEWPNALLGSGILCLSNSFSIEKVS